MFDGETLVVDETVDKGIHANGADSHSSAPTEPAPLSLVLEQAPVVVRFKKTLVPEIEIDPNALTWDDMLKFQEARDKNAGGELPDIALMEIINNILSKLTGQDVRKLPARVVNALIKRLGEIMGEGEAAKN